MEGVNTSITQPLQNLCTIPFVRTILSCLALTMKKQENHAMREINIQKQIEDNGKILSYQAI